MHSVELLYTAFGFCVGLLVGLTRGARRAQRSRFPPEGNQRFFERNAAAH